MARPEPRTHRILITGATEGLGFALAKSYASRGHVILATGSRRLLDEREHFGTQAIVYVRADQSEPDEAARQIADALARLSWDTLDLAVLNAGAGWTGDPAEETPSGIAWQVKVNLAAPVAIAQAVAPQLIAAGGRLALVGSTAAKGHPRFATYAATKGALEAFARSLREEWRGRVPVTLVHPGPLRTQMHAKAGLKTGFAGRLFTKPHKAARAIELSIRRGEAKRRISRFFMMRSRLSRRRDGEL